MRQQVWGRDTPVRSRNVSNLNAGKLPYKNASITGSNKSLVVFLGSLDMPLAFKMPDCICVTCRPMLIGSLAMKSAVPLSNVWL